MRQLVAALSATITYIGIVWCWPAKKFLIELLFSSKQNYGPVIITLAAVIILAEIILKPIDGPPSNQ